MSSLKLTLLLSLVISITSCSQFRPFEDHRREPGTPQIYVGSSTEKHPVICYNPLFYDKTEIQILADELCQKYDKTSIAEFKKQDLFSCRLFVPAKAYYDCIKQD